MVAKQPREKSGLKTMASKKEGAVLPYSESELLAELTPEAAHADELAETARNFPGEDLGQ